MSTPVLAFGIVLTGVLRRGEGCLVSEFRGSGPPQSDDRRMVRLGFSRTGQVRWYHWCDSLEGRTAFEDGTLWAVSGDSSHPGQKSSLDFEVNMILLIGGTGSSGKTKLAHTLMRSLGVPYLSIDSLMMGLYRSNPRCGYTPMGDDQTINQSLWPIVLEMIKTNIENHHPMIFEGFQILPENIQAIPEGYRSQVVAVFLTLSEEYIRNHYPDIVEHRSIIEARTDVETLETMVTKSRALVADCAHHNQQCHAVQQDYVREMEQVVSQIASSLKGNLRTRASPFSG